MREFEVRRHLCATEVDVGDCPAAARFHAAGLKLGRYPQGERQCDQGGIGDPGDRSPRDLCGAKLWQLQAMPAKCSPSTSRSAWIPSAMSEIRSHFAMLMISWALCRRALVGA